MLPWASSTAREMDNRPEPELKSIVRRSGPIASEPPEGHTRGDGAKDAARDERPASDRIDDARLVAALRRGDATAAPDFFAAVAQATRASLGKVLGPSDPDSDDLCQVAFEKIVSSVMRGTFDGRCSLATWASVIASRVAIDALRRRRHERRIFRTRKEDDEEPEAPAADLHRPDREVSRRRDLVAIRNALGKISPEKAETVVLFEVMGHDLSEIASMTGVSPAAAQSRLVRGRKELAKILEVELGLSIAHSSTGGR